VDSRDLPPVSTRSQLRHDVLLDEWVALASHRQSRTFLPPADQCPLDPSRPGHPTEIPEADYEVVVFENRFPSLATSVDQDVPPTVPGGGPAGLRPGFGRCEVVVFTSDHDRIFAELGAGRARLVVDVWAERTEALGSIPGVEYVFCFENHGEEIGVTLSHPHGQIYAYPYLPPRTEKILASVRRHRDSTGGDLFAEVVASERSGPRVVAANEHWTAFVPAAARWPYEVQLFPHRKVPDLPALTGEERDAFVAVYLDVLGRFARRFDTPMPYIASWNQAPVHAGRDDWWLHLQVFSIRRAPGKLKYLAGSESGMGAFITDTVPEDVAEQLRNVGTAP
jgi:galactose-1-phosphate uridylyltransferase (family 1)